LKLSRVRHAKTVTSRGEADPCGVNFRNRVPIHVIHFEFATDSNFVRPAQIGRAILMMKEPQEKETRGR
jgi:hypothetical protein